MRISARTDGTIVFVCFVGPGPVAGLVPWLLSGWRFQAVNLPLQCFGAMMIAAGAAPLGDSILRFVREGRGTPAPYAETKTLVVSGCCYRYVRNPMYAGVLSIILGQALLLWNSSVLVYGLIAALPFHLSVTMYEEPRLRRKYGDEYAAYCRRVRRWMPNFGG